MFNFRSGRTLFALAVALMRGVMIEMKTRSIAAQAGRPNLPPSAWSQRPNRRVKRARSAVSLRRRALKAGARRSARKRRMARKRA